MNIEQNIIIEIFAYCGLFVFNEITRIYCRLAEIVTGNRALSYGQFHSVPKCALNPMHVASACREYNAPSFVD